LLLLFVIVIFLLFIGISLGQGNTRIFEIDFKPGRVIKWSRVAAQPTDNEKAIQVY